MVIYEVRYIFHLGLERERERESKDDEGTIGFSFICIHIEILYIISHSMIRDTTMSIDRRGNQKDNTFSELVRRSIDRSVSPTNYTPPSTTTAINTAITPNY